ncbi:hypothetical protein [Vreelandella zhaodongensis]|uniref:hypothetical protein n=1 Tax=Vreelandella zhaodongensis TaxID=1176240 RepID=UPI003EBF973D
MSDEQLDLGRLQGMVLAAGMIARSCPVEAEEILKAAGVRAGDDLDGCAAFDIKQLIEARIEMPGLHAAWQKARREENTQAPPGRLQATTQAGIASVRRSYFVDEVSSPTVKTLLETYAGLSNTGDVISTVNSNTYGTKWVEETLLEHANAQRSKGTWRRIAYRDFLFAMSALRISPLMAIDAMKKFLVQPDVAGRQLAFLVDVIGDLIGPESPSKTTVGIDWELGEVYAETTWDMSPLPHEPRKWLTQAYMEFRAVLRALGVKPNHALSTLDELSKENQCDSKHNSRYSKAAFALLQAYAGQQWPAPQDELSLSIRWALLHQPSIAEEQLLIRVYQEVRESFDRLGITPEHAQSVLSEHETNETPLVVKHNKPSCPTGELSHYSYCRYPAADESITTAAFALLKAYACQQEPNSQGESRLLSQWLLLHQPSIAEEQLLIRVYQEVRESFTLLGLMPERVQSVLSEHESSETPPGQQKEPPHE